jgi:hypothetical protein
MLNRITGLIILSFILCSYDPAHIHLQGVIVDENTSTPIVSAKISVRESTFLFTDSLGGFKIDQLGSGFEILIEKNGYKPKYINFSNEKYEMDNAIIKLQPTNQEYKSSLTEDGLRFINTLIKVIFSLFNAFTIIFILVKSRIKLKFLWIIGIMLINPELRLLEADLSVIHYQILNGPFYFFNYWNYPYTLLIAVPFIAIIFWILYLAKSGLIKDDILEISSNHADQAK